MTTIAPDNSIDAELNRTISWQYDNATKLIAMISAFKDFFTQSTKNMWESVEKKTWLAGWNNNGTIVLTDVDDYGLKVWGDILGVNRPVLTYTPEGGSEITTLMSTELYRKILVARIHLLEKDATFPNLVAYVNEIFGTFTTTVEEVTTTHSNITLTDVHDMSISAAETSGNTLTAEEKSAFENAWLDIMYFPAGVKNTNTHSSSLMFWLCTREETNPVLVPQSGTNGGGLDNSSFTWYRK